MNLTDEVAQAVALRDAAADPHLDIGNRHAARSRLHNAAPAHVDLIERLRAELVHAQNNADSAISEANDLKAEFAVLREENKWWREKNGIPPNERLTCFGLPLGEIYELVAARAKLGRE